MVKTKKPTSSRFQGVADLIIYSSGNRPAVGVDVALRGNRFAGVAMGLKIDQFQQRTVASGRMSADEISGHTLVFCGDYAPRFRLFAPLFKLRLAETGYQGPWSDCFSCHFQETR